MSSHAPLPQPWLSGDWQTLNDRVLVSGQQQGCSARSGNWYVGGGALITSVPAVNGEYAYPLFIGRSCTTSRIGIEITTPGSAGSVLRLGIRHDIVDGVGGYPSTLLLEGAATIDGTQAAGFYSVTLTQDLNAGLYWLTCVAQIAAPTLRAFTGPNAVVGHNADVAIGGRCCYRQLGVTGALPTTFNTAPDAQGNAPVVQLKIA